MSSPDQMGLLWAISGWFAEHGVSIESVDASTSGGVARDVFLVTGSFDPTDLSQYPAGDSGVRRPAWPPCPLSAIIRTAVKAARPTAPPAGP